MNKELSQAKTIEEVLAWLNSYTVLGKGVRMYNASNKPNREIAIRQVEKLTLERAAQIFDNRVKELRGEIFPDGQGEHDRENYFEIAQAEADAIAIRALSPTNPKEAK